MYKLIILIFVILCVIIATFLILVRSRVIKKNNLNVQDASELMSSLGGKDNISNFESKISRLNVFVNDVSLVNVEIIRNITNAGVSVVNNKVQIVLNDDVEKMSMLLNELKSEGLK
ncbi:MAG: hypothetical protein ACK5NF_07190 [Bacilli bacterium]